MSTCYNIAGQPDKRYQRCNTTNGAAHSACCAINKTFPDICLDSGLCLASGAGDIGGIFENGCTDIQGTDAACPNACTKRNMAISLHAEIHFWCPKVDGKQRANSHSSPVHNNSTVQVAEVFRCARGKWCCRPGRSNINCCDDGNAQVVSPAQVGNITSSMLDAIRVASGGSSTVSNTTDPNRDADSRTAAVVGGVLGGVLVAALVGLATALWLWRRERRERRALQRQSVPVDPNLAKGAEVVLGDHQSGSGLLEADAMHERVELPEAHRRRSSHELPELPVSTYM